MPRPPDQAPFTRAGNALVVLTRPEGQNEALASRLRASGVRVAVLPLLALHPSEAAGFPDPGMFDAVVFVSGAAAHFYFERWAALTPHAAWPARVLACTVGPASARVLRAGGLVPQACIVHPGPQSPRHDSEALWALLAERAPGFSRVLIVRGQSGREWLSERFASAGVAVTRFAAYSREAAVWSGEAVSDLVREACGVTRLMCLVTSEHGVDALVANVARHGQALAALWERVRFVTIHPRVAKCLQCAFPAVAGPSSPALVCAPDELFRVIAQAVSS